VRCGRSRRLTRPPSKGWPDGSLATKRCTLFHVAHDGETLLTTTGRALHVTHDGETLLTVSQPDTSTARVPTDFEVGFFIGILVGEGHFGGDGRNPQITLRMHTRHEQLFRWVLDTFGGKLYGPYHHGGRRYFQWMMRGRPLRDELLPLIYRHWGYLDEHIQGRIEGMCRRYAIPLTIP
jgi:hypothetical protein